MRKYVYTLKSDLLEQVIKNYIDYVSNPYHEWRQEYMPSVYGEGEYNDGEGIKPMPLRKETPGRKQVWNLPKPRYENAKADVVAIVNIMYRSCLRSEEEGSLFTVPSKYLMKISHNYNYILDTLKKMWIITITNPMSEGNYSRSLYEIRNLEKFHLQELRTLGKATVEKINKIEEENDKKHRDTLNEIRKVTPPNFVERYNANLARLTIDKQAATAHVNTTYDEPSDLLKRKSRLHTIRKIASKGALKEIRARDDNGRIYHIGTEMQRDIKPYTNIARSFDCKNSHPFLLTYLLLQQETCGTIRVEEEFDNATYHTCLRSVIKFLQDNRGEFNHYMFCNFFRKNLKNSDLKKSNLAKISTFLDSLKDIPSDVWRYIYDVSMGKIWDMFADAFNEDRTIVKQEVFKSVIYSYSSKRKRKLKEEDAKWVEIFEKLYPSVYRSINKMKQSLHEQCEKQGKTTKLKRPVIKYINNHRVVFTVKDDILLPLLLMRLESKIFTKILDRLFKKRVVCFGIHDAVAVIKSKLSDNEIKNVMLDVYAEYGLIPTLSVD